MANNNQNNAAILPLPPLEYDVQYFNNMVRILNFWVQQQQTPGNMRGTAISLTPNNRAQTSVAPDVVFDTLTDPKYTTAIIKSLPTSATGLESGQVWVDTTTHILHIVP
jgi:hypothetical protein